MTIMEPKALLFDVFGTCVDWRSTVTRALVQSSQKAADSSSSSVPSATRSKALELTEGDWGRFAQEWRNTYMAFTKALASDSSIPWKSIDEHHLDSLRDLVKLWGLDGLWTSNEIQELSLIWHQLDPWADSELGIKSLNRKFSTASLSNGNLSLLNDLKVHARLDFTHIFSAEQFGAYKPSGKVYLGAVERLGLEPSECAMVATHLGDLKAAKSFGLKTIYIERPEEEDWDAGQIENAKQDGSVDLWISAEENGFIAAAEKLGIS